MALRLESLLLGRRASVALATLGIAVVLLLAWIGYVAVRGWQRSVEQLAAQQADEGADLLLSALTRDMQAVQRNVLSSPSLDTLAQQPASDIVNLVASAFARYEYPEAFYRWRSGGESASGQFFIRRERPPEWVEAVAGPNRFPVELRRGNEVGELLLARVGGDAARGKRFSVFELQIGQRRYQVVARLFYRDRLRQSLDAVFAFTVNLDWTRERYFGNLMRQVVAGENASSDTVLRVLDGRGALVATSDGAAALGAERSRRSFPVFFFSPLLVAAELPGQVGGEPWVAEAVLRPDSPLRGAVSAASRMLVLQALAALTLMIGVALTVRAARASVQLTDLRSDFVSSVSHEFKTPIATIRAAGETLASGRLEGAAARTEYAGFIVQESRRLARLVDNLLAFSRLTDISAPQQPTDALSIHSLVEGTLQRFEVQLTQGGFTVHVDIPDTVPPVRGDGSALALMLDNLIDNVIRHSRTGKDVRVRVEARGSTAIVLDVIDTGGGIAADEVRHVTRKFYRGRDAGHGGTGLGLAIASRIAADHGGALRVLSEPGVGTTVRVVLPAATRGAEQAAQARRKLA